MGGPTTCASTGLPKTGSGVVPRMGNTAAPVTRPGPLKFFLTRKSAHHIDAMAEVNDSVVHTKGFAASTDALVQAHPNYFTMQS